MNIFPPRLELGTFRVLSEHSSQLSYENDTKSFFSVWVKTLMYMFIVLEIPALAVCTNVVHKAYATYKRIRRGAAAWGL